MAITSLIIDLSGTATFTDGSTSYFHGASDNGVTYSVTGTEGYETAAEIYNDTTWDNILSNLFVNISWAIANFTLNPSGTASKTISDMIIKFTAKATTDGNNINADYQYPPWDPNPGLGSGTHFEVTTTYQNGRRSVHDTCLGDALLTEIGDHPASLAAFRAAINAALEDVGMLIV